jgi:hypothetical protein
MREGRQSKGSVVQIGSLIQLVWLALPPQGVQGLAVSLANAHPVAFEKCTAVQIQIAM